jgi:RNA recognition motif-containing protein
MTYQAGLQHPSSYSEQDGTNLYVRNLPLEMTSDLLLATFTPYGKVLEHRIMRDFATGISLGFGFVRFEKKSEADAAIATLNGHTLGTIPLVVKVADKVKEIGQVSDNVYIKQMPLNWDENNVRQVL